MATQSTDQLLLNRLCYCGKGLREVRYAGQKNRTCRNCCRQLTADDNVYYRCQNGYCLYLKTSTISYWLCSTCYRQSGTEVDLQGSANRSAFVCRKFQSSLEAIS